MTTATTETNQNDISLRGKSGWSTMGTTIKATIGVLSTTLQTASHGYSKGLEVALETLPDQVGQSIAKDAKRKGLKGITASIKSNDATNAAIDSIYYAKEALLGHNVEYTKWYEAQTPKLQEQATAALDEDLLTKDQIVTAIEKDQATVVALITKALA